LVRLECAAVQASQPVKPELGNHSFASMVIRWLSNRGAQVIYPGAWKLGRTKIAGSHG
jgi:hypothetical protein